MEEEPVVGVLRVFGGDELFQSRLHFPDILPRGKARPVADPEDVGVDGHGGLVEDDVEHDVRCLAPHPAQLHQLFPSRRKLSAKVFHKLTAQRDDVLRLRIVESD